jgi:mannose-6-phosphate isomerase-like protein (cupin superfamily)
MVRAGDILSSPTTGETFYFLKTAADTHGRLLAYEIHADPAGRDLLAAHVHPRQEERFEVLKGVVEFTIRRRTVILEAGESLVVPAGTAHTWRNLSDHMALLLTEMEPAGQMETLIETLCATARNPRFRSPDGTTKLLPLAVMLDKYRDHLYPVGVQKAAIPLLAAVGRTQGFQPEYSYFDCVSEAEREVSIMLA